MYTKTNFKRATFTIALGFLFASCLTNVDEEIEVLNEDPANPDPCASVTFAADVKPIIDANCVQCHGAGGNFPNLTTYNGVSANAAIVKSEVVARTMPQGTPLSDAEIQAISCWVDNGALNN